MKKLSLAYFGTPYFSARFLEKLVTDEDIEEKIEVKLVVTQPDKPVGRKQEITPSPTKTIAEKYNITIATGGAREQNLLRETDLVLVYAYGEIIPKALLNIPTYGFWNIHPSLLPKYRGPSPIAYPLILGETKTGVTLIQMDEKIDHGPIIAQEELPILRDDRRPDLETKLTDLAFKMIKKIIEKHGIERKPQDDPSATYTHLLKKSDGFIPLENLKFQIKNSPEKLYNLFRGLYPWPGIWTLLPNGKRLKITDMELGKIKRVQLEGKKEIDFETFNKAYSVF